MLFKAPQKDQEMKKLFVLLFCISVCPVAVVGCGQHSATSPAMSARKAAYLRLHVQQNQARAKKVLQARQASEDKLRQVGQDLDRQHIIGPERAKRINAATEEANREEATIQQIK